MAGDDDIFGRLGKAADASPDASQSGVDAQTQESDASDAEIFASIDGLLQEEAPGVDVPQEPAEAIQEPAEVPLAPQADEPSEVEIQAEPTPEPDIEPVAESEPELVIPSDVELEPESSPSELEVPEGLEEFKIPQAAQTEIEPEPSIETRISERTSQRHVAVEPPQQSAATPAPTASASKIDIVELLTNNVLAQIGLGLAIAIPVFLIMFSGDKGDTKDILADKLEMQAPKETGFPSLEMKPKATGLASADRLEEQMRALAAQEPAPVPALEQGQAQANTEERTIEMTQEQLEALLARARAQGQSTPGVAVGPSKPRPKTKRVAKAPRGQAKPAPVSEPQPQRRRIGRFFESGEQLGATEDAGSTRSGKASTFAVGTTFEVKLDVGITSSRHGTVIAKLTRAVKTTSGTTLPKGTVLKGRSSDDGRKVFVEFMAVMTGNKALAFRGSAVSGKSKTPGVVAKRQGGSTSESRTRDRATNTAVEVGKDLVEAVGGRTGEVLNDLADGAGDEATRGRGRNRAILTLDAGTKFKVVVTQ